MLSTDAVPRPDDIVDRARPPMARVGAMSSSGAMALLAAGLAACDTRDRLCAWLGRFAQAAGFDRGEYLHLGHHRQGPRTALMMPLRALSTYDDISGVSRLSNAATASVPIAFLPFAWSDREAASGLDILNEAGMEGRRAGITIPVQDHAAGPACLVLSGGTEDVCGSLVETETPALIALTLTFHLRARALIAKADLAGDALSDREIECLRLAALGEALSGIAGALGISARTVEIHVGRAARKLSAVNKVHAVAVAVGAGLIRV